MTSTDTPKENDSESESWRHGGFDQQNLLLLDCQTSGMTAAEVIEIGWQLLPAGATGDELPICSEKVAMAEPSQLSKKITRLTGITPEDLVDAKPLADVLAELSDEVLREPVVVLIHYAVFERRFLPQLLDSPMVRDVICTHKLATKLWPQLPSKSLRSVSGYLGMPVTKLKRSADHIAATAMIWHEAKALLCRADVHTWQQLDHVLSGTRQLTASQQAQPKSYRLAKDIRLALPAAPGVYHLLAADGSLLYVGKAVNLKARVNSYFRGRKTKGSRLNELVSQVSDVRFYRTAHGLEAELLEQQHIARYTPPYNVALVTSGEKAIAYCDSQLNIIDPSKALPRYFGPLIQWEMVDMLAALLSKDFDPTALPEQLLAVAERRSTSPEALYEGVGLFLAESRQQSLRRLALEHWRQQRIDQELSQELSQELDREQDQRAEEAHEKDQEDQEPKQTIVEPWQATDVQGFLQRRLAGIVRRCHRGRWLRRLRYADLWWTEGGQCYCAQLRGDAVAFGSPHQVLPGSALRPALRPALRSVQEAERRIASRHDYDRATIVLAFIKDKLNQKPDEGLWLRCYPGKLLSGAQLRQLLPSSSPQGQPTQ